MKKLIALFISASIIAAPVVFADEPVANPDAAMQQMTGNDQAVKPVKKARHGCHCKNCAHKTHSRSTTKKVETETQMAPAAQ